MKSLVLCLVYVGCVVASPVSPWKVPFEHPGGENRYGDHRGPNDFGSLRPNGHVATFSPLGYGFGYEHDPQNYNNDRLGPFKGKPVPMMFGSSLYMNNPESFNFNEYPALFQGYGHNNQKPHYNHQHYNVKQPISPENNNVMSPFNFDSGINGLPRSIQYESEKDQSLHGHHHQSHHHNHHHDHKPLPHEDLHADFPSPPHSQPNLAQPPALFENNAFPLHNFHGHQGPYDSMGPKPGNNIFNEEKDDMKPEFMPLNDRLKTDIFSQSSDFGRPMAFENAPNDENAFDQDFIKHSYYSVGSYKNPVKNYDNRPISSVNNQFGHQFSDFNNNHDGNKFVQGHLHSYPHNYRPVFYGEPQFGFASFPYHQLYNSNSGAANLKPFYFHENSPFPNTFSPNLNFNGPKNNLRSATESENKQEEDLIEKVNEMDDSKRGHGHNLHQPIYYKPVMTDDGVIKFVPIFHPLIGQYIPFEFNFGAESEGGQQDSFAVMTEEGDIKFVSGFHPQIAHYTPFEFYFGAESQTEQRDDSEENSEETAFDLENSMDQKEIKVDEQKEKAV